MNTLYLLFPQWQGSGASLELYHSAKIIQSKIVRDYDLNEVPVSLKTELEVQNNILGYREIREQLDSAIRLIKHKKPDKIFTIGGDCGTELAPISFLDKYVEEKLGVIWFDAHGDLNTPASSPSKKFHGMPLRVLLNEGDAVLTKALCSNLNPDQVILAGVRDLDDSESTYIKTHDIELLTVDYISTRDNALTGAIQAKGFENIYIHIDLDVLDPHEFPTIECPVPKGLSVERLFQLISLLKQNFSIAGGSVVEYSSEKGRNANTVCTLIDQLFNN